MIRSIIVEDELQSIKALKSTLLAHMDMIDIIAVASNVKDAVKKIDELAPDVVFLDVRLSDGSGFDVLERTLKQDYKVIFTTAYNEYATEAFRVNAVDYLLKPINKLELSDAISKVLKLSIKQQNETIKGLMQQIYHATPRVRFATKQGYELFEVSQIVRCESDKNYTKIFLLNQSSLCVSKPLKDIESLLKEHGFERVHQSHLINIKFMKKYESKDGTIILNDKTEVPVSRRNRNKIIEILKRHTI